MRIALLALFPVIALAAHQPPHLRHRKLAETVNARDSAEAVHAQAHQAIKRVVQKRGQQCRVKGSTPNFAQVTSITTSSTTTSSTTTSSTTSSASASATDSINNQEAWAQGKTSSKPVTSTTSTSSAPTSSAASPPPSGGGGGVMNVNDAKCGWCGSSSSEPNGSEDWLNCGINNGGWSPPHVTMDQIIATDLHTGGVFAPCAPYIDKFNQYARQYNIHPIMLASFAMQESTCNPGATGGGGEAGLMQIAPPNCNAPDGNCYDVDYNIRRAAELFSGMISQNGGNVLAAIGSYNGWRVGMTYNDATAARWTHCWSQNNLDYLYQFLNGWMQGKSGYSIGSYFNLKGC